MSHFLQYERLIKADTMEAIIWSTASVTREHSCILWDPKIHYSIYKDLPIITIVSETSVHTLLQTKSRVLFVTAYSTAKNPPENAALYSQDISQPKLVTKVTSCEWPLALFVMNSLQFHCKTPLRLSAIFSATYVYRSFLRWMTTGFVVINRWSFMKTHH